MQFMAPDSEPSRISVMQGNSSKGGIKMGSSNLVHCVCVCVGVCTPKSLQLKMASICLYVCGGLLPICEHVCTGQGRVSVSSWVWIFQSSHAQGTKCSRVLENMLCSFYFIVFPTGSLSVESSAHYPSTVWGSQGEIRQLEPQEGRRGGGQVVESG